MTQTQIKEWLKEVFKNVIEDPCTTDATYAKYFSKDLIQYIDCIKLDYNDFVARMKAQKLIMKSLSVTFQSMLVEDNKISTVHLINGVKNNGEKIAAKVIALFHIQDNKIIYCDELTHLLNENMLAKNLKLDP